MKSHFESFLYQGYQTKESLGCAMHIEANHLLTKNMFQLLKATLKVSR